ncbi:MAG: hypothetical protein ACOCP8_07430 [archaeon]
MFKLKLLKNFLNLNIPQINRTTIYNISTLDNHYNLAKSEKKDLIKLIKNINKKEYLGVYKIGGGWGDRIEWFDFKKRKVVGWKNNKPQKFDLLISKMESGKVVVFTFINIEYCSDPHDMFFGIVKEIGFANEKD